jgi:hypothetical protein
MGVTTMKRHDQGHLHPKLEVSNIREKKNYIVDLSAGPIASSVLGSGSPQFFGVMSRNDQAPDPLKRKAISKPEIRC